MSEIVFTWHEAKNKSNAQKHKVDFEEAQSAFNDEFGLYMPDSGIYDEERFVLLGTSNNFRQLVVVHCYRETSDVETIRIISARKANNSEIKQYRGQLP